MSAVLHDVVRCRQFGGPDVLEVVSVPVPAAPPGAVRIRVERASVNFADIMRRAARPYPFPTALPYIPGSEVVGTIDALGDGVQGPPIGTRVLALVGDSGEGGYAQYAIAHAGRAIPLPPGLDPDVAATVLVAGTTASLIVADVAQVQPGEVIYVPAAAGGVGTLVVQLARQAGATVIAGASSPANRDRALENGAHAVVDDASADWPDRVRAATGGRPVDVFLAMAGGDVLEKGLGLLAPFGRAIVYGAAGGAPYTLSAAALDAWLLSPAAGASVTTFNLGMYFAARPAVAQAAVGRVIGGLFAGELRVDVSAVLPLSAAAEAHRRLEARYTFGKLLLNPWT
jgi:NADPH:quinone reductase-like Zn-dependent oxidoreductase